MEIIWDVYPFQDLSVNQLYDILHLRNKIFVVEQQDIYLDLDYEDHKAVHILGIIDEQIIAYCRVLFEDKEDIKIGRIGRVLVDETYRGHEIGRHLMVQALEVLKECAQIEISAQLYLLHFYQSFGFETISDPYYDGTIEHVKMIFYKKTY